MPISSLNELYYLLDEAIEDEKAGDCMNYDEFITNLPLYCRGVSKPNSSFPVSFIDWGINNE